MPIFTLKMGIIAKRLFFSGFLVVAFLHSRRKLATLRSFIRLHLAAARPVPLGNRGRASVVKIWYQSC